MESSSVFLPLGITNTPRDGTAPRPFQARRVLVVLVRERGREVRGCRSRRRGSMTLLENGHSLVGDPDLVVRPLCDAPQHMAHFFLPPLGATSSMDGRSGARARLCVWSGSSGDSSGCSTAVAAAARRRAVGGAVGGAVVLGVRVGEKQTVRERGAPPLGYTYFLTTELLTIHGHGHHLLEIRNQTVDTANCGLDCTNFTGSWKGGLDCTKITGSCK